MSLTRWQRSIVTEAGDTIASAEVEVFYAGSTSKPDLFSDAGGTTALTNPFSADASGFAAFYVAGGLYDIAVNGTKIWTYVALGNVRARNVGTGADDVPDVASFAVTGAGVVPEMIGQGAIVDIIENSNGTAVRWESGLQVCWISRGRAVDWQIGTSEINAEWTFPAGFSIRPYLTNALVLPTSSNRSEGTLWVNVSFSPNGGAASGDGRGFTTETSLRGGSVKGVTDTESGETDIVAEEFTVIGFWK